MNLRKHLSTWCTRKPTEQLHRRKKIQYDEDEREKTEDAMLALGHDLDRMAWDMSCDKEV